MSDVVTICAAVIGVLLVVIGLIMAIFPVRAHSIMWRYRTPRTGITRTVGYTRFSGIWLTAGGCVIWALSLAGLFRN
jgi:hypothetical protein